MKRGRQIKRGSSSISEYTKLLSRAEIKELKRKNAVLDKKHNINTDKLKPFVKDSILANMTHYQALTIFNEGSVKEIDLSEEGEDNEVVLSVIMPYFRAGYIGWIPFEAMIRQRNINFKWEIIIIEENFENPFGLKRINQYAKKLKEVGCVKIKYISLKEWLPLSAKWYFLISECSETSIMASMNSADVYFSKHRLAKQYKELSKSDKNWHKIRGNVIYDIGLDSHVKISSMNPDRTDTCCATAKLSLLRRMPLACIKINVDGWRYNTLMQAGIKIHLDSSGIIDAGTVNINGLNNLSVKRASRIKELKPPLQKCCGDLGSHIPAEVLTKLKKSKRHIDTHLKIRDASKIKLRKNS